MHLRIMELAKNVFVIVSAALAFGVISAPVDPVSVVTVTPVPVIPPGGSPSPIKVLGVPRVTNSSSFGDNITVTEATLPSNGSNWCSAISGPGVKTFKLFLGGGALSNASTSCYEHAFEMPSDDADYEIVAWEAIVDKPDVVFYMIMYQCDAEEYSYVKIPLNKNPVTCSLLPQCSTIALLWAPGTLKKRCYDEKYGIRFGQNYFNTTFLRIYYFNPAGIVDSSGFRVYYQRKSRPNNVGLVAWGNQDIAIPPKTQKFDIPGLNFTEGCSKKLLNGSDNYTFLSLQFVIHDKGNYASMALVKSDGKNVTLFDKNVTADQPPVKVFPPNEVTISPGDSVQTICSYNTMKTNDWTYFGETGFDGMCYAFVEVSPPVRHVILHFSNFFNAVGKLSMCDALPPFNISGCNGKEFVEIVTNTSKEFSMVKMCLCAEAPRASACSSGCYDYLNETGLMKNPCITTDEALQSLGTYWIGNTSEIYRVKAQMNFCRKLPIAPAANTTCIAL